MKAKKQLFSIPFQLLIFSALYVFSITLNANQGTINKEERLKMLLKKFPEADANKDGVLTNKEAIAFNQKRRKPIEERHKRNRPDSPTHANVKYGKHKLQAFDLWLAKTGKPGKPRPLCIYIHGGGFRAGDKSQINKAVIDRFLGKGISFASINYRLTNRGEFPYPAAMHDCARALQYIRSKAPDWNIDPEKIVCYGGSAGGGITLWLAFHDDLADSDSKDPVAKHSTRILAAGAIGGQSTYDMRTFRKWFGVPDLPYHSFLKSFYGMKKGETIDTPRVAELAEDASPINHLSKDDPPVFMSYGHPNSKVTKTTKQSVWIHHPMFGIKLREAMDKHNIECIVNYPDNKDTKYKDIYGFLIRKLSE